jgi:hypothetical protein
MEEKRIGGCMKPIWLGIVFFLVYGMFSIKSHAAQHGLIEVGNDAWDEFCWHSSFRDR